MRKITLNHAKQIMGTNFMDIEESTKHYGTSFTTKPFLHKIANAHCNFTEETIQECKDTYLFFVGLPMTITDIRAKIKKDIFCSTEGAWFYDSPSATAERVAVRGHLIRKDIVPNSRFKKPEEQVLLLGPEDIVPRACELIYMMTLWYFARDEKLFSEKYARCLTEADSEKPTIYIGFSPFGLGISNYWGDCGLPNIGLASARKPDF